MTSASVVTATENNNNNNNNDDTMNDTNNNKRKKMSTPPDSYTCKYCGVAGGHWIQQCSKKKGNYKKPKKSKTAQQQESTHIPIPGVDPSPENVKEARDMQKITPPPCYCGSTSRLKKVKRSHQGGETSRAIGNYFFFCSKGKLDGTKCKFAKPALTNELKTQARGPCRILAQTGTCPYGDKCMFRHDDIDIAVFKEQPNDGATTTICKDADVAKHTVRPVRKATIKSSDSDSDSTSDSDSDSTSESDSTSDSDSDSDSDDDQQF